MSDPKSSPMSHSVVMNERKQLKLTGVCEVLSFDEENMSLHTECGALHIEGKGMHITTLDIDQGNVIIDGQIDGLFYAGEVQQKRGFLGKVFG